MSINFEAFLHWAEDRFGDIVVKGNEIKVNSIFAEDNKHHLWCSPSGGKHFRDAGCYRCFYTDRRGTLVGLVMLVDNCTYEEARNILSTDMPIGILEEQLEAFFKEKENKEEEPKTESKLKLPPEAYLIEDLPKYDIIKIEAEEYLKNRKLPVTGLYICKGGEYRNRILIPYYDKEGKLVYFNCRSLTNKGLRYLGPDKKVGVGKGDVIYAWKWPNNGERVYLTEGEFDSITLCICGFNSMACGGKYLTDEQIDILKNYKICLALDEDISGLNAIIEMGKRLRLHNITDISFVRPPKGIKDWNKMLIQYKPEIIEAWINKNEKMFDEWSEINLSKL